MIIIIRLTKKFLKSVFGFFITLILILLILISLTFIIQNLKTSIYGAKLNVSKVQAVLPFTLNSKDISYTKIANEDIVNNYESIDSASVLNRAKAMVEVKWIPKYNLVDKYGYFVFIKGKTYCGIPYSMGPYQADSASDFLSKINGSQNLIGNDCSGFVSSAWGISRQTTLSLLNAVKSGSTIEGKSVRQISYEELKPGDALLLDNGKGKGHIILYINTDKNNKDNIFVYEQNVSTIIPFEPLPVARMDNRSLTRLKKSGYIAIRLEILS